MSWRVIGSGQFSVVLQQIGASAVVKIARADEADPYPLKHENMNNIFMNTCRTLSPTIESMTLQYYPGNFREGLHWMNLDQNYKEVLEKLPVHLQFLTEQGSILATHYSSALPANAISLKKFVDAALQRPGGEADEMLFQVLVQVLSFLAVMQELDPGFRHNDINANTFISEERQPFTFRLPFKDFSFFTRLRVHIIDFGSSFFSLDSAHVERRPVRQISEEEHRMWGSEGNYLMNAHGCQQNPVYDLHMLLNSLHMRTRAMAATLPKVTSVLNKALPPEWRGCGFMLDPAPPAGRREGEGLPGAGAGGGGGMIDGRMSLLPGWVLRELPNDALRVAFLQDFREGNLVQAGDILQKHASPRVAMSFDMVVKAYLKENWEEVGGLFCDLSEETTSLKPPLQLLKGIIVEHFQ